jgi:hypothetical protein
VSSALMGDASAHGRCDRVFSGVLATVNPSLPEKEGQPREIDRTLSR